MPAGQVKQLGFIIIILKRIQLWLGAKTKASCKIGCMCQIVGNISTSGYVVLTSPNVF